MKIGVAGIPSAAYLECVRDARLHREHLFERLRALRRRADLEHVGLAASAYVDAFDFAAVGTLGNLGINSVRGPAQWDFDVALSRRFSIGESQTLEFRAEAFNLFNRVQFGLPSRQVTTSATSTLGQVTSQANQPRLMQLAFRLTF